MSNTSQYMEVIAKIMQNKKQVRDSSLKNKYNELYTLLNSNLNPLLKNAKYPRTPEVVQKVNSFLDTLEHMCICPEIIGKKTVLISSFYTEKVFSACKNLFCNKDFVSLFNNMGIQIPFLIMSSDDEDSIEVLNYANIRNSLKWEEFHCLIIESRKRKIALNKILKYIVVKTRICDRDTCVISDNIYADAERFFSEMISQRIAYIDKEVLKRRKKNDLKYVSALLICEDNIKLSKYLKYKNSKRISTNEITGYIHNNVRHILYGLIDAFNVIRMQILGYYYNQMAQSKHYLNEVKGDIVRLGKVGLENLQNRRNDENIRYQKLESEYKDVSKVLDEVHALIVEVAADIGDDQISKKQIPRKVLDEFFEAFFFCTTYDSGIGKELLSRLYLFDYEAYDLVITYVQKYSGHKKNQDIISIKEDEWEKAKMLLYVLNLETVPDNYLKQYVDVLGNRCRTGKEFYAKALVSSDKFCMKYLQESFEKGYKKAGYKLLELYHKGESSIDLLYLANALIPEACIIVGDQKIEKSIDKKQTMYLSNKDFVYYKIAASQSYLPAIGKIVDIFYESLFSSENQVDQANKKYRKHEELKENLKVVCRLCHLLIDKEYQEGHYSEILGAILYALSDNYLEAMHYLADKKSGIACYFKGLMYERGEGVSSDIDRAIQNYEIAKQNGFYEKASERIAVCLQCKEDEAVIFDDLNLYDPDEDYRSSSESTPLVGDDGCFAPGTQILMADGTHRNVEDIRKGDKVMVFDHYKGELCSESIIANVHDNSEAREYKLITLNFEGDKSIKIVKSHVFLDKTDMKYVWLDDENIDKFLSHEFVIYYNHKLQSLKLLNYSVETKLTNYYVPVSRYHLNVFAEGFLTMPPTKLTLNMFNLDQNMRYDLSIVERLGKTRYEDVSHMISKEEYTNLPCEYLTSVMALNQCDLKDFEYAMLLFRDQSDYFKLENKNI